MRPPARPQPAKVAAIEYPREPGKDEAYAWLCTAKAAWVADALLGARAQVRCARGASAAAWLHCRAAARAALALKVTTPRPI